VNDVADDVNLSAATVRYHMRHMKRERVIEREPDGTKWRLAEPGQMALTDYMTSPSQGEQKKPTKKEKPKGKHSVKRGSRIE